MEAAPLTQYAVRGDAHVGYQAWGSTAASPATVDVLEFGSGLMISIDETVDEPNWLRYTQRLSEFCRLIRFDAGGLGLSDPFAAGVSPSIEGWAGDALAVMDAARSERAVLLASMGGAMGAIWLAAHHPERVSSVVLINGTARVGWATDYPVGVNDVEIGGLRGQTDTSRVAVEGVPRDVAAFAPSLAHRVGFQEWWGRAARRGASPATATAFNVLMFTADVREHLSDIECPVLVLSRVDGVSNM